MTERNWLLAPVPMPMLEFILDKTSDRKLQLFACACCRLVWHLLPDRCHQLVQAVEGSMDKETRPRDLAALFNHYRSRRVAKLNVPGGRQATEAVDHLWQWLRDGDFNKEQDMWMVYHVARSAAEALAKSMPWQKARHLEGQLLHDLFGPLPFRPVTLNPSWLAWHGGLLVSMARQMYDSRDFTDLPMLADALEEAGCSDQDILGHCRSGGEHVRGCFAIDAILGRK